MKNTMHDELDAILGDGNEKPQINFEVDKMVKLLEELQLTFQVKMNEMENPIKYKTDFSICRLPDLKTANEKLILNFLTSVEYASTAQILDTLLTNRMTTTRSIKRLCELGYVSKIRTGEYCITKLNIF